MPTSAAGSPRDTLFVRRSLMIAAIGGAVLGAAGWLPVLHSPWVLSVGALGVTFGLLNWAVAGSSITLVRAYGPLWAGLAVSNGVDAMARSGSLRDGLVHMGETAVIVAGLIGVFEVVERRPSRANSRT